MSETRSDNGNPNLPPHTHELQADGTPAAYLRPDEEVVFGRYAAIIRRLRGADGCPWDRKQTLRSLRRYIIEESFEVLAAIEDATAEAPESVSTGRGASISDESTRRTSPSTDGHHAIAEELGDVLLVTMLLADALEKESSISLRDILIENGQKLIRRHPHVFGDVDAPSAEHVVVNWNEIKTTQEGRSKSALSVSDGLPPLEFAYEVQKKAAKLGFDWPDMAPVIEKMKEEVSELEAAVEASVQQNLPLKDAPEIEEEIGDILFSAVNLSRHVAADPSVALSATNHKFLRRIDYIERRLEERGSSMQHATLEEMDQLWEEAKQDRSP